MTGLEALPFLGETGHVISLVGGGGKTTLLYALARHYSAQGQRVLVSTTTHIRRPDANYAPDEAARDALWQAGTYAVVKNGWFGWTAILKKIIATGTNIRSTVPINL